MRNDNLISGLNKISQRFGGLLDQGQLFFRSITKGVSSKGNNNFGH